MDLPEFQALLDRPIGAKVDEFQDEGRLRHLIFAAQFTPELLANLFQSADLIRQLSRQRSGINRLKQLLSHKRAMLYFTQPSTRTFLSFMAACQILGLTCNEVRDASTSSETKRESPMDSIRMFSSYFDLIIMRSPEKRFAECCAYLMNRLAAADVEPQGFDRRVARHARPPVAQRALEERRGAFDLASGQRQVRESHSAFRICQGAGGQASNRGGRHYNPA